MGSFRYTAKDKDGRSVSGIADSADEKTLVNLLRKQELIIISIRQDKGKVEQKWRKKVKLSELVLFSRQLATMIESGIPLVQGLDILSEQMEDKQFKNVLADVRKHVTSGTPLYEALAKHPEAFSPLFINMAKAGESSGTLDDIMNRLALYLEKTDQLVRKVRSAMIYPIVVTSMAVLITLVMLLKVVPVFKSMFSDFGADLPLPTLVLVAISDFLIHTFVFWIAASVVGAFMFKRWLETDKGSFAFDNFKLNMPVFGAIMKKVAVSKFTRTLSTLVKSGVPILSSLEIVQKTAENKVIEKAVEKVRTSIREGESISGPLMRSKVFPPMVVRMIAVGEQTGQLEKMLSKISDFYDDQVDTAVSGLTSLIEPLIIAFLGIVIGGIVICMFLPIFKLSTIVSA